jgi:peptide deformylase
MAVLPVILYGDPVLRRKAAPIETIDDEIRRLAEDMIETMYEDAGIGLAAPQVDRSIRMLVADGSSYEGGGDSARVFINPVIIESWGERNFDEGCLSIPGIRAEILRPDSIRIRFQDLDGETHEEEMHELWSRVLQHETDHLDGKLFIDYLSPMRRALLMKKLKELARESKSRVTA